MPGSGGMAERPNAKLLKSFGMQVPGGSNPSPSAVFPVIFDQVVTADEQSVPPNPALTCIFAAVLVIYGSVAHGPCAAHRCS